MVRFHETLLDQGADLLEKTRNHRFLADIGAGKVERQRFARWFIQNYLFVKELETFMALLGARAPRESRRTFWVALVNLGSDIEILEEMASKLDIDLSRGGMAYACHAYVSFLHATVSVRSYEEALAACYSGAVNYLEAWSFAGRCGEPGSPWQELVDLWTKGGLPPWVEALATLIDSTAPSACPTAIERMRTIFRITQHYALRYWDMAAGAPDW